MLQRQNINHSIYIFLRDHGVAVVTSALHAEVPRFDPGWCHYFSLLIINLPLNSRHIECCSVKKLIIQFIPLFKTPWCSRYFICLTRRRSRFDPRLESLFSLLIIYLALTHNILNVAASKNQSFNIQLFNTPWCSGYPICLTRRRSRVRSRVMSLLFIINDLFGINSQHIECGSVKKLIIQFTSFQDTMV